MNQGDATDALYCQESNDSQSLISINEVITFKYDFRSHQITSILCLAVLFSGHISAVSNGGIDRADDEVNDIKEILQKFYLEGVSCIMNNLLINIEKNNATTNNFIRKLISDSNTYFGQYVKLVNEFDELVESHQCHSQIVTNNSKGHSDLVPEQQNESKVKKIVQDKTVEEEEEEEKLNETTQKAEEEEKFNNKTTLKQEMEISEGFEADDDKTPSSLTLLDRIRIFFAAIYYSLFK